MRIWLVQTGEEMPFDGPNTRLLRTAILADELVRRGHDVTYINASFNHQQKKQRSQDTTIIEANAADGHAYRSALLSGRAYQSNISVGRFLSHRENARAFTKLAPRLDKPDLIYAGFPPIELAHEAVHFAHENGIPSVVDCRDMWPQVFYERLPSALRWMAVPLFSGLEQQRRATMRKATAITGITNHFVDWGIEAADRQRCALDRPFHLAVSADAVSAADLSAAQHHWDNMIGPVDGKVRIGCFAGTLARRLDLETMLDGLDQLSDEERACVRIVLCGNGDLQPEIEKRAARNPALVFGGWCNRAQLAALMERSDFGVLPYPNSADFLASYPNKVGEYLMAGLPILSGLRGTTGTLLDAAGLRLGYDVGNAQSFANGIRSVLSNGISSTMATKATALGAELFDPARIYPEFADWLEQVSCKELSVK